ncbi:PucR family transcriptional regulator [Paenibacillus arenilitoris]|uniref:Helix-turn-helix domain-containing protein n=1 Tax=Paenibacillus arenilitoris TaxID=2772299 RepID=A0A927CR52_9BACL|nr:helix-turn-helix domain-containing protein [Paenibacillus arenilitoris]MBD2872624.1 helix-turn-helix domain-containing protein [Paenibacillus arenilitoris]
MSTTDWLKPLQHILNCPVHLVTKSLADWHDLIKDADAVWLGDKTASSIPAEGARAEKAGKTSIVIASADASVELIEIDKPSLQTSEKELISWTLQLNREPVTEKAGTAQSETERSALKLSEWIQKQLESDEPAYSLPDHLTTGSRLFNEMIPFLLVTEQTNTKQGTYAELEKLLRSFLSDDVLLIPLKSQEWLIWGSASLLRDEDAEAFEEQEDESLEDSLASIGSGLHEMLASEWIGECHLAVAYPAVPAKGMVETTILLRETLNLGRKFHVGTNIHLPWMLQLERLLNAIPETQRTKYLEQSLKRADFFVESEMLSTIETFFALDCNVSETAKKLYIHRNTLLYRLDKLKQETGLDVRQFRDAVLVKIILLLYKVTKRN